MSTKRSSNRNPIKSGYQTPGFSDNEKWQRKSNGPIKVFVKGVSLPGRETTHASVPNESLDTPGLDGWPGEPWAPEGQIPPNGNTGSSSPESAKPAEEKDLLRETEKKLMKRPDLIELLRQKHKLGNWKDDEVISELHYTMGERAGMAMDGGLSRDDADQAALRLVLGIEVLFRLAQEPQS